MWARVVRGAECERRTSAKMEGLVCAHVVPCCILTLCKPCVYTHIHTVCRPCVYTHIHTVCRPCVYTHIHTVCRPCVFTHTVYTQVQVRLHTQRAFSVSGASCFGALCKHVCLPDVVLRSWWGYPTGWVFKTQGFRVQDLGSDTFGLHSSVECVLLYRMCSL